MFHLLPTLVLVPHADAGDRNKWQTHQDLRPLTQLGREQAAALAPAVGKADAVITSPARRCVETVEPIAAASNVVIELDDGLRELGFVTEHEPWAASTTDDRWRSQLASAAGLGRFIGALARFTSEPRHERIVVGAHGDLVPLFALLAAAYFGVATPTPIARGGAYEIDARAAGAPIKSIGALASPPA